MTYNNKKDQNSPEDYNQSRNHSPQDEKHSSGGRMGQNQEGYNSPSSGKKHH